MKRYRKNKNMADHHSLDVVVQFTMDGHIENKSNKHKTSICIRVQQLDMKSIYYK